ncbi:MAG: RNA polymerase sigma factor, partial [Candidatus Promineifilaceae bacterium]
DRHAPIVLGVLFKIVGNRSVAEELLQETFWRVWDRADNFNPDKGRYITWMFSIARRLGIDTLRRWKSRPTSVESEKAQVYLQKLPSTVDVAGHVSSRMEHEALRAAIEMLPPEQRIVIELSYFKGMTRKAIAEELTLPLGTVHTRARMGLQRLRAALIENGWETVA